MRDEIRKIQALMESAQYVTDAPVATSVYLATTLRKPLLVEGHAGVGKTEIAKVMAQMLGTKLIRLQCYEGLDAASALYEWNYQKQLLHIKLAESAHRGVVEQEHEIFSEPFLLRRPLLEAISHKDKAPVLLVDEVDRADEEFEAFMLEIFAEWQVTIPEIGTIKAIHPPHVILTSNRTRELSDALLRRCLHLYVDFPGADKEAEIIALKVPEAGERLRGQVARFVTGLRRLELRKTPSIAETLDWARGLCALGVRELDAAVVRQTLALVLKHEDDLRKAEGKVGALLSASTPR
jgi:MoxR-like ATPase